MRRGIGLLALGLAGALLQGTLATFAPTWVFPDLVFLWAVGLAIVVGGAEGLLLAVGLGYAVDLLSGALLGQHALLLGMAWGATRVANLQLNLLRALPRAAFIAGLTVSYDLGHAGLLRLFAGDAGLDWSTARQVALHTGLNAAFAPAAVAAVRRTAALLTGEEEPLRRTLRMDAR